MSLKLVIVPWLLLSQASSLLSATWFVATNGVDSNPGTSNAPFATIRRAQTAATSGDTVYLRGGTYFLNNSHLTLTNSPWAVVINITNSGISYIAYPGERPVFDFSAVAPYGWRTTAFQVWSNGCVFKGFDIVGVPIVILTNGTQSECFRVQGGNNNRFEHLRMHDGHGIGFYLTDGASNVVWNCDAYNNWGVNSNSMGNIDGFGFHSGHSSSVSNVIHGCRAWFNSDDGYDLINNRATVVIENCWAMYNGFTNYNFVASGGNANGFKAGGYGLTGTNNYPKPTPRNTVRFCLAVGNGAIGFYANHHTDGLDFINNTAFRNGTDYNMVCNTNNLSTATDVDGFNHVLKNNIGFGTTNPAKEIVRLNTNACDASFNHFTMPWVAVSTNDFMSLDESLLTLPRQPNGDLPYIAFAQLVGSSDLLNAGTNVGFAYTGSAPDLGCFEYGTRTPPTLAMTRVGASLVFTGSNGPAGGTNYLVAATNVSSPMTDWSRVATNEFDLGGTFVITNSLPGNISSRFYRIKLP